MKRNLAVIAGVGLIAAIPRLAWANSDTDRIKIRDQWFNVWPTEDLKARGLDVQTLPKDQNAAWRYIDAINAYEETPPEIAEAFQYAVQIAWPEGQTELAAYLNRPANQRAFELIQEAAEVERCQLPYFRSRESDGILSVLLPNLSHMRILGKMLTADARRLESQGDFAGAMRRYRTVMTMAIHVDQGITLIEALVAQALWNLSDRGVIDLAMRKDLSEPQLRAIDDLMASMADKLPSGERGIKAERTVILNLLDEFCAGPASFLDLMSGSDEFSVTSTGIARGSGWAELQLRLGRLLIPDRIIRRNLTTLYDNAEELFAEGGIRKVSGTFDPVEFIHEEVPRWDVFTWHMVASYENAAAISERTRTQHAATRAIVAIRAYQQEHDGTAPMRLEDALGKMPRDAVVDPFSGEPLIYRRTDDGWLLYSVSLNLVDDGGVEGESWRDADIVWTYPPDPVAPFNDSAEEE